LGFFRRRESEDGADEDEALARVEKGGIPPSAESRLTALGDGAFFTSGLSVKEFALLDSAGPRPLAQVMGASVVRTGWQYLPALEPGQGFTSWYASQGIQSQRYAPAVYGAALHNPYSEPSLRQVHNYQWYSEVMCELDVLGDAWNMARRRALDRLSEEALQLRADAVVGVHLRRSDHDFGRGTIEFAVSGTAIRVTGSGGDRWPVLTDLSVQDYWRLLRGGHEPAGLLATTVVVFASPPRSTRLKRMRTIAVNQELSETSNAFRFARDTVRARLRGQISDARGLGAVGVEFSHTVHRDKLSLASSLQSGMPRGWHVGRLGLPYFVSGHSDFKRSGWVITMHAAGTAIRPRNGSGHHPIKTTVRMEAR
jgi:hypothetical protein